MGRFIGEEDEDEDDKEMKVFSSENRINDLPDSKEFPIEERKKGLIQQERPCGNGRQDKNPRARTLKRSRGQKGTVEYAIEVIPMSYKFPGHDTIHRIENPKEFPLEERKKGWIQQERPHGNGRRDKYYYHLKSRANCRSLREVHDFIKHGIPIRLLKELVKSQPNTPQDSREHTFKRSRGQKGTGEYAIEAIPLSFKYPNCETIHRIENPKELRIEERKRGWIEQERPRRNGRRDKYYYHLKATENCRSLLEVYDFIKHGIPIKILKKLRQFQPKGPKSKRNNGASLLRQKIVGSYNEQTQTVSLQETPQENAEHQPQEVDASTSAAQHVVPFINFEFS